MAVTDTAPPANPAGRRPSRRRTLLTLAFGAAAFAVLWAGGVATLEADADVRAAARSGN